LNWLDIVLLLVLGLSLIGGLKKGIAREIIGLIAAIVAFVCGLWFYGSAGSFLLPYVSHKGVANFIGFLGVFLGVVLLGTGVGFLLKMLLKWAGLSWLDRLMGGVFGILRGILFSIVLVLALMAFTPAPPPSSVVRSRLAPYVIDAAHICPNMAPREVKDGVAASYEKVKAAWAEAVRKARKGVDGRPK